jgi:hypothetical protein
MMMDAMPESNSDEPEEATLAPSPAPGPSHMPEQPEPEPEYEPDEPSYPDFERVDDDRLTY